MTLPDDAQAMGGRPSAAVLTLESFLSGRGECMAPAALARLRAGTRLRLRRATRPHHCPRHEVLTLEGQPLGWLPQEDADWLEDKLVPLDATSVRVAAMVPAFGRPRIVIRIAIPADCVSPGPATA